MRKKIVGILVVLLLLVAPLGSVYAYEVLRGHTGVVIYDKDNALPVYTLFATASERVSYLIDLQGNVVHEWRMDDLVPLGDPTDAGYTTGPQVELPSALQPGLHDRLLTNGHLLRGYRPDTYGDPAHPNTRTDGKVQYSPAGGTAGGVLEFDWAGNLVWWYPLKDETHIQHHTFYRVEDPTSPYEGNTFILGWELIDTATAEAAGRDVGTTGPLGIYPDFIREVNQAKQTVWEWRTWDHIEATGTDPYKFFINAQTVPINQSHQDWTHGNTVEFNPVTDQVIINFRNWGEFFVIDHAATFDADCLTAPGTVACDPYTLAASAAGDIIFRWGNPGNYGAGTLPSFLVDGNQRIFGEHCVVWLGIDDTNAGTPGNILILDNGWQRPAGNRSRSVEITANGIGGDPALWLYPASPEVWNYASRNESSFYSAYQCGSQRLAQDDVTGVHYTFITSTGEGQFMQIKYDPAITPANARNQVVWNFVVPGLDADGNRRCYHNDGTNNSVHRAHQYRPTYPGLAGRKLTVKYPLSGDCTQFYDLWDSTVVAGAPEAPVPLTGWGFTGTGIGGGGAAGGAAGGGGGGY